MTSECTEKYPWGIYGGFVDGLPHVVPPWQDRKEWLIPHGFQYITRDGFLIHIPAGFRSDLASVPRILRSFVGVNRRESYAAIVHDYGCKHPDKLIKNMDNSMSRVFTRKDYDQLFYHIMLLCGVKKRRAVPFYAGVSLWRWIKPLFSKD